MQLGSDSSGIACRTPLDGAIRREHLHAEPAGVPSERGRTARGVREREDETISSAECAQAFVEAFRIRNRVL
jgi:hypothetical protein